MTRLDHYLKEQFVYVYHIHVNRIPRRVPLGVSVLPAPRTDGRNWGFILRCDNVQVYNATVSYLKAERMIYAANVDEKKTFVSRFFNPTGSFTYNAIWTAVRMAAGFMMINLGVRIIPTVGLGRVFNFAGNTLAFVE